jgi:Asp-tRNA(Asn)/Glu-tRNA(Gln) amidotransferase A subunit family amidase
VNLDEARRRATAAGDLNAFIVLSEEMGSGPSVGVKDLIEVRGLPTTGGGIILPDVPAKHDAPLVERIRAAGCSIVGKTNLFEWAYGASSRNPHYGDVRNPRALDRSAGGSSSGSAAAVAAGLCDWAVGTDTAGSIRVPASFCGVVGFKPSYGSIPIGGVIPLSRSLDTVGALASTVDQAAAAVGIMTGDPGLGDVEAEPEKHFRIAACNEWVEALDEETSVAWAHVEELFPRLELPDRNSMSEVAVVIQAVEAAAYHRRWLQECPERYGQEVRARLEAGLKVSAVDYLRAREDQEQLRGQMEGALEGWDAIVLPATATVAPPLTGPELREPLLRFTRPFSLTGNPAIVVPFPTRGLPVGIQIVGRIGGERRLVAVARTLESAWDREYSEGSNL